MVDDISYVRTTNVDVKSGNRDTVCNVQVINVELVVTFNSETKFFAVDSEKVKYIHYDYYQYSM